MKKILKLKYDVLDVVSTLKKRCPNIYCTGWDCSRWD